MIYSDLPWFNYNRKYSYDCGLYIKQKDSYNAPQRDIRFQSVPGRNGDVIIDNGRYKNITLSYEMSVISPDEFWYNADNIKNWLMPLLTYYKLYDVYDPYHFRYAILNCDCNIVQEFLNVGKCTLDFNCKPFRYNFSGERSMLFEESGSKIINNEKHSSLPYIKIYGIGDITLYINGTAFYFYDVADYIEVDSEIMNCYKDTQNMNNKMQSDGFPELVPGCNIISWNGATKVEIKPRWRTL